MDLRTGTPFWLLKNGLLASYPVLAADERADVAIVGAGITGALAAYRLSAAGANVVVLDKRDVGTGSTVATTGLLQYATDTSLGELAERMGEADAVRVYRLGVEAIDRLEALCDTLGDRCGFARRPTLYLASRRRDVEALRQETDLRRRHGFDVEWLTRQDLAERSSLIAPAALFSRGDGQIDCYRLTHALLRAARTAGARVFDRTDVTEVRHTPEGMDLVTADGPRVRASRMLAAAGYETANYLKTPTGTLSSTWAFVSEPLERFDGWPELSLIWETARPYLYLRATDDGRLMAGGEDEPFSRRHQSTRRMRRKTDRLLKRVSRLLPQLAPLVSYAWAGVFGSTDDGLPIIGSTPEVPNTWFALGYGGNGITFGSVAADILCDAWLGRTNPDANIFRFDRPTLNSRH